MSFVYLKILEAIMGIIAYLCLDLLFALPFSTLLTLSLGGIK